MVGIRFLRLRPSRPYTKHGQKEASLGHSLSYVGPCRSSKEADLYHLGRVPSYRSRIGDGDKDIDARHLHPTYVLLPNERIAALSQTAG